jgi:hypothetical protein
MKAPTLMQVHEHIDAALRLLNSERKEACAPYVDTGVVPHDTRKELDKYDDATNALERARSAVRQIHRTGHG